MIMCIVVSTKDRANYLRNLPNSCVMIIGGLLNQFNILLIYTTINIHIKIIHPRVDLIFFWCQEDLVFQQKSFAEPMNFCKWNPNFSELIRFLVEFSKNITNI